MHIAYMVQLFFNSCVTRVMCVTCVQCVTWGVNIRAVRDMRAMPAMR